MATSEPLQPATPLMGDTLSRPISRRALLRRALAAGVGLPLASSLLAACSPAAPAAPTSAAQPTAAAAPGATPAPATAGAASASTGRLLVAIPGDWATLDPALYTNVSERE